MKNLFIAVILSASVLSAADFQFTAKFQSGYCSLPDVITGMTSGYSYYPMYEYSSHYMDGNQLLSYSGNRLTVDISDMNKATVGWNYGFGVFFDRLGFDLTIQHGTSFSEKSASSNFSFRDTLVYSSIPHDYFLATGTMIETASLSYFRSGLRFCYKHPITKKLSLDFAIGPFSNDIKIDYIARTDNSKRAYYTSNGNNVYNETLPSNIERVSLHVKTIETVPDIGVSWKFSKYLDFTASIAVPFSAVKTMQIGESHYSYNDDDLTLDNRFWLSHAQLSVGVTMAIRKE
ncbi:MAG: hypothetical protein JNL74_06205 [Fibrobacteres bacterium]|nr:hypothetical protein [Fibrobacterota bacterium]